ncbi:peroxide stress protein YaaA [Rhodocyclus tenuis]|uniref:peroxide stress protein YaaA n=1 Tax=Rhodocyclus tenuis TaxID=1066 RepID=UPI001902F032|nr:peroxide stress protein YaaA [Rhodocyclus tenuis]MBK1679838.1 peroxide stress protein YaaA [Rhodocyclus tenuis]
MIIVLSPAKTLDFSPPPLAIEHSQAAFLDDSQQLIERLRQLSPADIASLMGLSDKLAVLNATRFADWATPFTPDNALQAVFAFNGDVYEGLDARQLSADDLRFAQQHLRILSGLYGILRPLDLMQAYRLEMGTRIDNLRGKDLYAFWGDRLAQAITADLAIGDSAGTAAASGSARTLVNLASEEYFKALGGKRLALPVVQPVFEDWSSGRYKVVSFFAKRARGLMARYAIVNRLQDAAALRDFAVEGYAFAADASDAQRWVFRRRAE